MELRNFHHPFEPYNIQIQFMEAVYNCIEQGKVGIFESPTGTGKSLSLICGSLTWLREHKRKTFDEAIASISVDDDEPAWMIEHAREARRKEVRQMRDDFEARLEALRKREESVRARHAKGEPPSKKRKKTSPEGSNGQLNGDEEQFVLDDYDSDNEKSSRLYGSLEYSSQTTKLMEKLGMLGSGAEQKSTEEGLNELKIFFCSRTHSQISQFVGELQRVSLPPGLPPENDRPDGQEAVKHVSLGSRKNLCINPAVKKLESQTAINERCLELQQSNTPTDKKCPYLPKRESEDTVLDFRDHALAELRDVEDLAKLGANLGVCPYYASRPAIGPAEIVTLPYPLLLQKSAREALGISLKGHIIIIDEAHNLINAIEGIYSAQIAEAQLSQSRESLLIYLQKFRNRLKGGNRVYVTQVIRVIDSLLQAMARVKTVQETGGISEVEELLSGKGVDQVNLTKLVRYISESKLARKVEGYVAFTRQAAATNGRSPQAFAPPESPTLTQVQNFLTTLMNPSKEGRFFWAKEKDTCVLRYLLLDPSEHFRDVVEEARAVILAGGTMSPMEQYSQQLFPYTESIDTLSCGHLIPKDNLLVRTISSDEEGPLEFTFKARSHPASAKRTGSVLHDLAPLVKGGLIVFFPSYEYLEKATNQWQGDGTIEKLRKCKPLYFDKRGGSAEETFKAYSDSITSTGGAILISVIGGKLSEGINFSNDLGRCVVVMGLPFPNLHTPEWKAKMQYLDDKAVAKGEAKGRASMEHAENVCMRSVNQAIGRVIRHKDDWAAIVLVDSRYEQERIKRKLPGWIRGSLPERSVNGALSAKHVNGDVANFFGTGR